MATSVYNSRAYRLLSQLQRQCRMSQQLLGAYRHASTQSQTKPQVQPKAQPQTPVRPSPKSSPAATPSQPPPTEPTDDGTGLPPDPSKDKKFVPVPLDRPLGVVHPPEPGENSGIDTRSRRQRRDDFVNYEKHIQRRKVLMKQASRPYYRDWKNLQNAKGKIWIAPERLFRADKAGYFPNLMGKTLETPYDDRDTTDQFADSISVVSLYSGLWAQQQAETFTKDNEELEKMLQDGRAGKTPIQKIVINVEQNVLRSWLVRLFIGNLKRMTPPEDHERYFMIRRGLVGELRESIGMLNATVGFTYLVDHECRIRWAASADAGPEEKASLNRGAARLLQEYHDTLGAQHWKDNGFDLSVSAQLARS